MGMSQKRKGIRGELLFRDLCREQGFPWAERMGQQMYQRGADVADVIGLPGIHIECKFVERLDLRRAMAQSERDTAPGELPIVAHKQSRKPWLITMRAVDWFKLFRGYQDSLCPF